MRKQTIFILALLALAACRNPKEQETQEPRLRDYPRKDTVKGALYATESNYPQPVCAGVPFYQYPKPVNDKRAKRGGVLLRESGRTVTPEIDMINEN